MLIGRCMVIVVMSLCIISVMGECPEIENCNTCEDPDFTCAVCNARHTPNAAVTECYKCPEYCTEDGCTASGEAATCNACEDTFRVKEGLCEKCVGHCDKCSSDNQCDTCSLKYRLVASTEDNKIGCLSCEESCLECGDGAECRKCRDGFYLANENCLSCPARCAVCTEERTCATCNNGYQWDAESFTCKRCIDNCETCDTNTGCTLCRDGWSLANDRLTCLSCSYCTSCSATGGCPSTACQQGYYAHNADLITCKPCDDIHCKHCPAKEKCTECDQGYQLLQVSGAADECVKCPNLETKSQCDECQLEDRQRFYDSSTATCGWCTAHCISCTKEDTCTKCAEGYYKSTDDNGVDTCLACSVMQNCARCSSATSCSACASGYYESATNPDACSECTVMPDCNTCTSSTSCSACKEGFYKTDASPDSCTACSVGNCKACSKNYQCSTCNANFYLENGDETEDKPDTCVSCPSPLSDLNSVSKCITECGAGLMPGNYHWSGCRDCPSNCLECVPESSDGSTTCTKCVDGYVVKDDGDCTGCTDSQCKVCSDASTCTECYTGYVLDEEDNKCYYGTCPVGKAATSDNSCTDDCHDTCFTCSSAGSDKCTSCPYGTYLKNTGSNPFGTCDACHADCATCSGSTSSSCETCRVGEYLTDSKGCSDCHGDCVSCSGSGKDKCTACRVDTFLDDGDTVDGVGTCVDCADSNCESCSSATSCSSCHLHSLLTVSNAACIECDWPCATCSTSKTTCTSCEPGFYQDGPTCTRCGTGCTTCSDGSSCDTVWEGFSAINTHIDCTDQGLACTKDGCYDAGCAKCDGSCLTCSYNATNCTSCHPGTYLDDNKCERCPAGCTACTSESACTTCRDGYADSMGTCMRCHSSCKTCSVADNENMCTSCYNIGGVPAYSTSPSVDTPAACTITGCAGKTNPADCTAAEAVAGCYLNVTECGECDNSCKTCDTNAVEASNCTTCWEGSFVSDGMFCVECDDSCKDCFDDGAANCTACHDGFYLSAEKKCEECDSGCATCTVAGACTSCPSGYSLPNCQKTAAATGDDSCADGYYDSGCMNCHDSCRECDGNAAADCTGCPDGYWLNNDGTCDECHSSCKTCSGGDTDNKCLTCWDGFYKNNDGECTKCSTSCKTCGNSASSCESCYDGFYLNGASCSSCDLSCKTCDKTSKNCTSCFTDDNWYEDGNECKECHKACLTCSGGNGNKHCDSCAPRFYKDGSATGDDDRCLSCDLSCEECNAAGRSACTACVEDKVVMDTVAPIVGECGCHAACKTCDGTTSANCLTCADEYGKEGEESGSCISCGTGCSECSVSSGSVSCSNCKDGYFSEGSSCTACSGCATCSSNSRCDTCVDGKYLDADGACQDCDGDCKTCSGAPSSNADNVVTSTNCLTCTDGDKYKGEDGNCYDCPSFSSSDSSEYTPYICARCPDSDSKGRTWRTPCESCPANCASCNRNDDKISCTSCKEGYFVNGQDQCEASTCESVETENECRDCSTEERPTQWQTRSGSTQCYFKPANCATMVNGICTACDPRYVLVDAEGGLKACGECTLSQTDCPQCGRSTRVNYWDTTDSSDPICLPCPNNCLSCGNDGVCTLCIAAYTPNADGSACVGCGSNCKTCASNVVCNVCYSPADGAFGYFGLVSTVDETGTVISAVCEGCSTDCTACASSSVCNTCRSHNFLKKELNEDGTISKATCEDCSDACNTCTDESSCTDCDTDYYLDNKACTKCPDNCVSCNDNNGCTACANNYFLASSTLCTQCTDPTVCLTCTKDACLSCAIGHYLADGKCEACMDGCNSCSDGTTCDDNCKDGYCYFLGGTTCVKSDGNCRYCKEDGECTVCPNGRHLEICNPCSDAHCLECNDPDNTYSTSTCTKCDDGYYADNGDCKACPCACATCDSADSCTVPRASCGDGFYLDNDLTIPAGGTCCKKCNDNCLCDGGEDLCASCRYERYYEQDNKCKSCASIDGNCIECSDGTCSKCRAGYSVVNEECLLCGSNCASCSDSNKCLSCSSAAYWKNGEKCDPCGTKCLTCTENGNSCTSCDKGYYLKGENNATNICEKCSDGCADCGSEALCNYCKDGFALVEGATKDSKVCVACPTGGCLACNGTTTDDVKCKKCSNTYYLNKELTCIPCSEAIVGCSTCLDYNNDKELKSEDNECEQCQAGKYIVNGLCEDCTAAGCSLCEDKPLQCTECSGGTKVTEDKERCLASCYVCEGSVEDCDDPASKLDVEGSKVTLEPCAQIGIIANCWGWKNTTEDSMLLGCYTKECTDDIRGTSYVCESPNDIESCRLCCGDHECNDGSAAESVKASLVVSLLFAGLAMLNNILR